MIILNHDFAVRYPCFLDLSVSLDYTGLKCELRPPLGQIILNKDWEHLISKFLPLQIFTGTHNVTFHPSAHELDQYGPGNLRLWLSILCGITAARFSGNWIHIIRLGVRSFSRHLSRGRLVCFVCLVNPALGQGWLPHPMSDLQVIKWNRKIQLHHGVDDMQHLGICGPSGVFRDPKYADWPLPTVLLQIIEFPFQLCDLIRHLVDSWLPGNYLGFQGVDVRVGFLQGIFVGF